MSLGSRGALSIHSPSIAGCPGVSKAEEGARESPVDPHHLEAWGGSHAPREGDRGAGRESWRSGLAQALVTVLESELCPMACAPQAGGPVMSCLQQPWLVAEQA